MRLSAAVLAATLVATAAEAREVVFPLVVDHALLRASVARQLREEADGSALVWGTRGGCRSLVLDDLRVGPAAGRVRVTAQATAHLGFRFLGFCFAPLSWKGNVESARARPVLEALATLRPLGVDVDDEGVKVRVALDLPPEDTTPSPPEPPL